MKKSHPLWQTLRSLKGNQKACVYTEPLWAIPNNLFLPFVSIYMAALGLQDAQIGMIASFGLAMQFLWALFSGAVVDKFGRRRTMLIFGLLSWTLPCMIWAASQGYWYFMAAVFLNSMWQVTGTSFGCLIVEDGDASKLINIWAILNLIGLFAGFVSPIIGLCIDRFTLVPTIRVVYLFAMVMMTIKFLLHYRLLEESNIGRQRREECKGNSLFTLTFGGWNEFAAAIRQSRIMLYVVFMTLMTCFNIIQATFWPLFITSEYGVSNSMISLFPLVKAITTIMVFLVITSRISLHSIRRPLVVGLCSQLLGITMLLIFLPLGTLAIGAVFFSAVCDAFALAVLGPLCEALMSVTIPSKERARTASLITSMILLISIPAGWVAGQLSQYNRVLPLVLNLGLLLLEILVALYITKVQKKNR